MRYPEIFRVRLEDDIKDLYDVAPLDGSIVARKAPWLTRYLGDGDGAATLDALDHLVAALENGEQRIGLQHALGLGMKTDLVGVRLDLAAGLLGVSSHTVRRRADRGAELVAVQIYNSLDRASDRVELYFDVAGSEMDDAVDVTVTIGYPKKETAFVLSIASSDLTASSDDSSQAPFLPAQLGSDTWEAWEVICRSGTLDQFGSVDLHATWVAERPPHVNVTFEIPYPAATGITVTDASASIGMTRR